MEERRRFKGIKRVETYIRFVIFLEANVNDLALYPLR